MCPSPFVTLYRFYIDNELLVNLCKNTFYSLLVTLDKMERPTLSSVYAHIQVHDRWGWRAQYKGLGHTFQTLKPRAGGLVTTLILTIGLCQIGLCFNRFHIDQQAQKTEHTFIRKILFCLMLQPLQ